jgi:hypothetical protein
MTTASAATPACSTTSAGSAAHLPIPGSSVSYRPPASAAGKANAAARSARYATIINMFCPSASTPLGRPAPRCTHAGKSSAAAFWISIPR